MVCCCGLCVYWTVFNRCYTETSWITWHYHQMSVKLSLFACCRFNTCPAFDQDWVKCSSNELTFINSSTWTEFSMGLCCCHLGQTVHGTELPTTLSSELCQGLGFRSTVSFPDGLWVGAAARTEFSAFWLLNHSVSDYKLWWYLLDWLIEQDWTSHQTHYRSYRARFLQVLWPNQQCQSTEGNDTC